MSSSSSLASQIILGLVLSLTSFGVGYQFGSLSEGHGPSSTSLKTDASSPRLNEQEDEEEKDEDASLEDEGIPDGDLAAVTAGILEPCKMVLVVRTDMKLSSGSIASQVLTYASNATRCCQATLACYKVLSKKNPSLVRHWEYTGQAKIALKAKSEDQLLELEAIAKSLNLCARSVMDPAKGTDVRSVLAIGPAPVPLINEVTGKLRLL